MHDDAKAEAIARVRSDFAALGRPLDGFTDEEIEAVAFTFGAVLREAIAKQVGTAPAEQAPPPGEGPRSP